jgi:hypothetical protein
LWHSSFTKIAVLRPAPGPIRQAVPADDIAIADGSVAVAPDAPKPFHNPVNNWLECCPYPEELPDELMEGKQ